MYIFLLLCFKRYIDVVLNFKTLDSISSTVVIFKTDASNLIYLFIKYTSMCYYLNKYVDSN